MEYTLFTKLAAEFVGTAVLMVFGNGAVANAELKNTKGYHAGWLNIAMGYGFGVMFPVLMFGGVSGAHINPAMTLAQAVNGMFPWNEVLPYRPAARRSGGPAHRVRHLPAALQGHRRCRSHPRHLLHHRRAQRPRELLPQRVLRHLHAGARRPVLPWGKANPAAASIVVGFIVWGLVTSMGGPTGPGLNPARDLMPRLLHAILPIPNKGDSRWGEAWIPVVAPIAGAIVGAFLFKVLFA